MRKKLNLLGLFLAVAMIGFIVIWSLSPPTMQKRSRDALMGKTLEEAKAILHGPPNWYLKIEDEIKKGKPIAWPAEVVAIGYWWKEPVFEDVIHVCFDKHGTAIRVEYATVVRGESLVPRFIDRLKRSSPWDGVLP